MIHVSDECYELMQTDTHFLEYATITLADTTVLNLTPADFTITNNYLVDGADDNVLPLGVAVEKVIQIEIANPEERYSDYDFYGAVIVLQLKLQLSNSTQTINKGTYTVIQPAHYGDSIIITGADDMYKADELVDTTITFPITLGSLASALCTATGITLASSTFTNSTLQVSEFVGDYSQYTYRELFGFIAQFAGGNARINVSNQLEFISYDKTKLTTMSGISDTDVDIVNTEFPITITFDEDPTDFQDMSIILIDSTNTIIKSWTNATLQTYVSGNSITIPSDSTIEAITNTPCILEVKWLSYYDGIWHTYRMLLPSIKQSSATITALDKWKTLTVETDDIQITGIEATLSAEQLADSDDSVTDTVLSGSSGYVLSISNPFFTNSNVTTLLGNIATLLTGLKLRPFSGEHIANPVVEFMDPVYVVDKKGNVYASVVTDVQFNVLGFTTFKNSAEPKLRSQKVYSSQAKAALLQAAEQTDKQVSSVRNYFWHDNDGAHVSTTKEDATTGPNSLMDSNGFAVRNGTTEVARFSGTKIELGKNAVDSIIEMCGGKLKTTATNYGVSINTYNTYDEDDPTTYYSIMSLSAGHFYGSDAVSALISFWAGLQGQSSSITYSATQHTFAGKFRIDSLGKWIDDSNDIFTRYSATGISDANDAPRMTCIRFGNSHGVSHLPVSNACFLLTFGSSDSNKIQFCTAANVDTYTLYMRKCSGGTWGTSWKSITFS